MRFVLAKDMAHFCDLARHTQRSCARVVPSYLRSLADVFVAASIDSRWLSPRGYESPHDPDDGAVRCDLARPRAPFPGRRPACAPLGAHVGTRAVDFDDRGSALCPRTAAALLLRSRTAHSAVMRACRAVVSPFARRRLRRGMHIDLRMRAGAARSDDDAAARGSAQLEPGGHFDSAYLIHASVGQSAVPT